jgi:hypothetical protein
MPKQPINYENTIIYKIVCNNLNINDCYVGHTTDFTRRKYKQEQRKEYFQKNKHHILQSIICECGKAYTKCHYKRHIETNRHQEYLKNKNII